jgi:hypothetical protein
LELPLLEVYYSMRILRRPRAPLWNSWKRRTYYQKRPAPSTYRSGILKHKIEELRKMPVEQINRE